jgi:hypothetical protein
MALTVLSIVISRSVSDVAISKRDSFASLGMTFMGQDNNRPGSSSNVYYSKEAYQWMNRKDHI